MAALSPAAWWRGLGGLTRSGSPVQGLAWALYDFANTIFSFAIVSFAMSLWTIRFLGEGDGTFWFTAARDDAICSRTPMASERARTLIGGTSSTQLPLIVTPEGEVRALDSKFTVDDNALFRHPDIGEMRDLEATDPQERLAREKGVTYVKLDGEIGILGNGAGLVMSTLDVIDQVGGRPANFCDLGGGGDAEGVVDALEVITSDSHVQGILFNIFGGITRCDEVARGILGALEQLPKLKAPIVVRLDGTNATEGRKILEDAAHPNIAMAPTMLEAASKAVALTTKRRR